MNWLREYTRKEREKVARNEAMHRIRIEDYGDDIVITIDGIKAQSITGDVKSDICTLNGLRDDFIKSHTKEH